MERPFDLYGDLEDAYDEAEFNGDLAVTETLDVLRLWDGRPRAKGAFLYTVLKAIRGDVEAQDKVGYAFYNAEDPIRGRGRCDWMDKPLLAQYWFGLAADAGFAHSQNCLGCLYCPQCGHPSAVKLGRFARGFWEMAAAQKYPAGIHNLTHCLMCGKCCCCDTDLQRAEALEAEAYRLEGEERKEKVKGR